VARGIAARAKPSFGPAPTSISNRCSKVEQIAQLTKQRAKLSKQTTNKAALFELT
jgi:hypothetical protein